MSATIKGKDSMDASPFQIRIIDRANLIEIMALYREAGWWKTEYDNNSDFLEKIVENSACFAGAFHEEKMVGMGRAISDRVSDAYIQDVVVLKRFQRMGIGKSIVQLLISHLKQTGVDWIGLIGTPGTKAFYEGIGFKPMENHIPFVYLG